MQLSPFGWAFRPLKNYANFSGRASRAEFWWFLLLVTLGYLVLLVFGFTVSGARPPVDAEPSPFGIYARMGAFMAVIGIYWLGLLVPSIAVTIRRLHDTNRSGWQLGAYVLLYILYIAIVMGVGGGQTSGPGAAIFVLVVSLAFFAYAITLLVFYCLPGTKGANRFGDDPYGPDVEQVFA